MMTIDHCTFYGNESISGFGEAIFLGGRADIQNSIFVENGLTGNIWVWAGGAVSSVAYSDFYGNVTNIGGSGSIPANFEVITTTNYNGDPCDVYYNIFEEDPLFEDAGAGNFQITWENFPTVDGTRSPCIDAGNPSFAYDSDGTITDMGRFFFDQTILMDITSPNGGEDWMVGDNHNITWSSAGTSGDVEIEYSTNNGSDWTEIIASTPDDGVYSWTVPDAPSDSCLVMVSDTNGNLSDTSDAIFTISPASGVPIEKLPEVYSLDVKGIATNCILEARYALPEKAGEVRFVLYNIAGLKVKEDVLKEIPAGFHSKNINMNGMSKGIYFINIEVNGGKFTKTAKFVLM